MWQIVLFSCFVAFAAGGLTLSPVEWRGRIIGGTTALKGQFPYQVSLRSGLNNHFCGGFIITDRWLGTAAHCSYKRSPSSIIAVVGAFSRTYDGVQHPIEYIANHPEYDQRILKNDISLMKTNTRIIFSPTVLALRLGSAHALSERNAIVSGWGYTSNPGMAANSLQWTHLRTMSHDDCRRMLTSANAARVFDTNICTISRDNLISGACMGDSGSPLVSDSVLIGIVSWGVPCAVGQPDVYTRVASYREWINQVIDF